MGEAKPETIFPLGNITSVTTQTIAANRARGIMIGLVLAIIAGCILSTKDAPTTVNVLIVAACGGVGVAIAAMAKDKYAICIATAAQETTALILPDLEYIRTLVTAINRAVVQRG